MEGFPKDFYEVNKDAYFGMYLSYILQGLRAKLGDPHGELTMNALEKDSNKELYDYVNNWATLLYDNLPQELKDDPERVFISLSVEGRRRKKFILAIKRRIRRIDRPRIVVL